MVAEPTIALVEEPVDLPLTCKELIVSVKSLRKVPPSELMLFPVGDQIAFQSLKQSMVL